MTEEEMEKKNTIRNQKARKRQRTVHVSHQQKTGETFDHLGLTKRNTNYMYRFSKAFKHVNMNDDKKKKIVHQMISDLLVDQRKGVTARRKYGTIKHRIHLIVHPPKKVVPMNRNYWPNAFYNMLIFFVLFNLLYGILGVISRQAQTGKGTVGFLGLIITSVVAGLGMPIITRLFDDHVKHRYSGIVRALMMIGMFLLWMAVFYLSVYIPRQIDFALNPWLNILVGLLSIAGAFWIHHKYNVTSAFRGRH